MNKIKLNKKDRSLLEILDRNSRKTLKEISKELKISKQAIRKKLE